MPKGMFVDTSICTGCKACQVACKEWNALPHEPGHFRFDPVEKRPLAVNFTGNSYDNTGALSTTDWRHVRFIEQFSEDRSRGRWLFSSDSCKHCNDAGCLNACPTGAIVRSDLGNVFIQQDVCIGCKYCIPSCPYGGISLSEATGTVHKCTLCNDRIHNGLGTACAKVCPTGSISFGEIAELRSAADKRLAQLKGLGYGEANIYGYKEAGGLNVFYLFLDRPQVYGRTESVVVPQRRLPVSSAGAYFIGTLAELYGGERHLLFHAKSGFPYINLQSPLSVGSWALLLFGAMAFLSFLDNLVSEKKLQIAPFAKAYSRIPRKWYAVVGSIAGFFVAGYTGVILNVTARPFWAATDPLVGALFIASAASTGAAAIYRVMTWRKQLADPGLLGFHLFDRLSKLLELFLVVGMVVLAGKYAAPLMKGFTAVMFWGGAVLLGTLLPRVAGWVATRTAASRVPAERLAAILAVLVLVGGALLRISMVQAGQVQ